MEDSQIEVFSIPLKHRIATTGYLFKEKKRLPNIIGEKIEAYQIPYSDIMNIKHGAGFCTQDGKIIPHEELVNMPPLPRSYAFCSDTLYLETILPIIQGVDLLYHEATFMHEAVERATQTGHSTALQAGMIAAQAKVKKLLLGHFSIRYGDLSLLQKEAQRVFPNTEIAVEGSVWHIGE
jgi:ribonuclease Z